MPVTRSPFAITFTVWKALFLREMVSRVSARRIGWVWLVAEPLFHIGYLTVFHGIIRSRSISGINTIVWVMAGVLFYYMFTRPARQAMHAVSANQALFVYRQIKPVDTVITRTALEGFLLILIAVICYITAGFFGIDVIPDDALIVLAATFGLLLLALGFGLITSVANELIPEIAKVIELAMMPLYIISGMMWPLSSIPEPYRAWVMLNPIAHGLELARKGFASRYHEVPETSMFYLYGFALVIVFLGLALHVRFSEKLVAQ